MISAYQQADTWGGYPGPCADASRNVCDSNNIMVVEWGLDTLLGDTQHRKECLRVRQQHARNHNTT